MEPDAVAALKDVATSIERSSVTMASMTSALVSDQADARARERRRYRVVFAVLGVVAIAMVGVLVQNAIEAGDRNERTEISLNQRRCSDIVTTAALARLAALATTTRTQVNADGYPILDAQGHEVPTDPDTVARLRVDVAEVNVALARISDLCYSDRPDQTPLDGDPTR